jgi:hypothetical protein
MRFHYGKAHYPEPATEGLAATITAQDGPRTTWTQ